MSDYRIVVVGHGALPDALLASARMIGGELASIVAVGLAPGATPASYQELLGEALGRDTPVVVLSDLRGGTPDNVANLLARRRGATWVVSNATIGVLLELALAAPALDTLHDAVAASVATVTYVPSAHARSAGGQPSVALDQPRFEAAR